MIDSSLMYNRYIRVLKIKNQHISDNAVNKS